MYDPNMYQRERGNAVGESDGALFVLLRSLSEKVKKIVCFFDGLFWRSSLDKTRRSSPVLFYDLCLYPQRDEPQGSAAGRRMKNTAQRRIVRLGEVRFVRISMVSAHKDEEYETDRFGNFL